MKTSAMKTERKLFSGIRSNRGLISVDFLFGFLLSFAFLMVFFALAYSLTIVEIVQYVAFASSRTYIGADVDKLAQEKSAQLKATNLVGVKFASFMKKSWFEVGGSNKAILKIISSDMSLGADGNPQYRIGVQIPLTIHLLDFHIPFFGSTKTTDSGEGFKTMISSYLIREPTQNECLQFNDNRGNLLKTFPPYSALPDFISSSVRRISDNGC